MMVLSNILNPATSGGTTTTARIGSIFLKTTDMAAAVDVLFPVTEPEPGSTWLEVSGDVPVFVELVPDATELHPAAFGIRVPDATDVRTQFADHPVSDLFDVAPGVRGFHIAAPRLQQLFIHE